MLSYIIVLTDQSRGVQLPIQMETTTVMGSSHMVFTFYCVDNFAAGRFKMVSHFHSLFFNLRTFFILVMMLLF